MSAPAGCINSAICVVPAANVPAAPPPPAVGGRVSFAVLSPASSVEALRLEAKLDSESADDSVVELCALMVDSAEPVPRVRCDGVWMKLVTRQLRKTKAVESELLSGADFAREDAVGSIEAPS